LKRKKANSPFELEEKPLFERKGTPIRTQKKGACPLGTLKGVSFSEAGCISAKRKGNVRGKWFQRKTVAALLKGRNASKEKNFPLKVELLSSSVKGTLISSEKKSQGPAQNRRGKHRVSFLGGNRGNSRKKKH